MPEYKKKRYYKIFIFFLLSVVFLGIYALISGYISVVLDDNYTLFGLPFSLDSFVVGIIVVVILIVVFLYFPKLQKAKELKK